MIRTEDVFNSGVYTFYILRIDGGNVLEQKEENRIARVRKAGSEAV